MDQQSLRLTTIRKEQLVKVGRGKIIFYPFGLSSSEPKRFSEGLIPSKQSHVLEWLLQHGFIETKDRLQVAGVIMYLTDKGKNALQ